MKPSTLLLCTVLLLGGCHSARVEAPEVPDRSVIILTPEQAKRHGLTTAEAGPSDPPTHPNLTSTVLVPAEVKVYPVGRTVDARDPGLLHEAHVIYRRETSPRWRLQAPADQRILIGPQLTDGRQDTQPLLTKELTAYLHDQRRVSQANEAAIAALFQAVERLAEQQRTLAERRATSELTQPEEEAAAGAEARGGEKPTERVKED